MKKIVHFSIAFLSITTFSFAATTKIGTPTPTHPNVHQINFKIKSEWQQTELGEKEGKITSAQENTLKTSLKSVHEQEIAFVKENGNHELTSEQTTQLDSTLTQVEQTLTTAGIPVPTPSAHH